MKLKPYPKYKPSGVEWLGDVPAHWDVVPLFTVLTERWTKNTGNQVQNVLSLSYGKIIERDVESNHGLLPESFETYQIIEPNDVILRLTDLQNDQRSLRVGQVKQRGIITSAYVCLRAVGWSDPDFTYLLLHGYDLRKAFYGLGGGVRQSMSFEDLKRLTFLLPPRAEQSAIVTFLDRETSKIDTLITKQEKLIELLLEKRQSVISHAVTKGLDPSVPMKPSGVAWLGEVPEHWQVVPIKHLVASIGQGWSPQCENFPAEEGEWGVLKVGCVNGGTFRAEENKALPPELEPLPNLAIAAGDLLVSRANTRELVGSAAVAPLDFPWLMLCDKLYRLRLKVQQAKPEFVSALLGTPAARKCIEAEATGASPSMLNIGQGTILGLAIALPSLDAQEAIMRHVKATTAKIDTLIAKARQAIELQKEHRTALISAAVTGKIDVRGMVEQDAYEKKAA